MIIFINIKMLKVFSHNETQNCPHKKPNHQDDLITDKSAKNLDKLLEN